MTRWELLQIMKAATDYVMFTVCGRGYTIVLIDGCPNIGEWGCKTDGSTFDNGEELLEGLFINNRKLSDMVVDIVVIDWC